MSWVALSGHLLCRDLAEAAVVREHLPRHAELTRAEPGCLLFEVRPTGDDLVWRVDETFASQDAFAAHQARTRASAWGHATAAIARRYRTTSLPPDALARPRLPSPLGDGRPTRTDLARVDQHHPDAIDDILPASATPLRLLIVGINPGLWTAAVNAPFAHPGNRFWPSLHRAGMTDHVVDASAGLSESDQAHLLGRGIGLTNLVGRATARAAELAPQELQAGAIRLVNRLPLLRPAVVAIAGITAFRTAFSEPKARLGPQPTAGISGWPPHTALWVVPQPSGLNAHENIDTLAAHWREVGEAADRGGL